MKQSYIRKNFTKLWLDSETFDELEYIKSCGLYAIPHTKESILVWNSHYEFATQVVEQKKNPVKQPYKKKKL